MVKKLDLKRRAFFGGIAGLSLGFTMIFIWKDNWGFLPALIGIFLLIYKQNGNSKR